MADKYDIYLEIVEGTIGTPRIFSFGSGQSKSMKGFYKGVMMWLKCLLTEPGTDLGDREYGTPFPSLIGSNITQRADLLALVQLSISKASDKVREYQTSRETPQEEMIRSAELVDLRQLSVDAYKVEIRLTNVTGDLLALRLPLDVKANRE